MKALLINPYIYDFSAYSFWSTPLGLLYLGSILRKNGMEVALIDCLGVVEEKRKEDGRAPFLKERMDKPASLKGIRKRFRRYGISREVFREELLAQERPDLILITSIMTYWYMGAREVLESAREAFPGATIAVGGIYPSLCHDHATREMAQADLILKNHETDRLYGFIERRFSISLPFKPSPYDFDTLPYPCFDLYKNIPFVPLLTSYGCAYKCTYCATPYMHPQMVRRRPGGTLDEIVFWHDRYGVDRYVVYDDSFLFGANGFAKPLLRDIAGLPFCISIYNPNAVNASLIDEEMARLLLCAGFKEVRIGLETVNPLIQKATGGKVDLKTFERAVGFLVKAGFSTGSVIAYILSGLPLQRWGDVKAAIDYLAGLGVKIHLAEYTPIPHTPMFDEFQSHARYPVADDPVYQNNALFPFAWEGFTDEDLMFLKQYARERNKGL